MKNVSRDTRSHTVLGDLRIISQPEYFGHLMGRADSLETILMLGEIEGKRRRGWHRIRWLNSITDSMDLNLSKLWKIIKDRKPDVLQSMGLQRVRHDLATEQQQSMSQTGCW